MNADQQKKWKEKLEKAKKESGGKDAVTDSPDLNTIKKKYLDNTKDNPSEIDETPNPALEEDIEIEIKSKKAPVDGTDEDISEKKVIIKSKSKGILGSQG